MKLGNTGGGKGTSVQDRPGLPAPDGDRIQLQQVILNLVVNAVEAMSGIDDEMRELRISSERDASGGVLVTVRDSGPGLDPKSVDRVFEAFHTTKPGGMGLGLAICRSITEAHGGRLWVSPNKPRGAAFQFTLPPRHGTRPFRPGTPAKRRKVPPAISMNERLDVDVERFKATIPACEAINLLKLSPADFG